VQRPFLLIGFVIWVVFILVSGKWSANPLIWGFQNKTQPFTLEQAREKFPHPMVNIQLGAMASYSQQLLEDDGDSSPGFNLWDWAALESRSRFLITVPCWMGGGFLLIWFLHRSGSVKKS